MKFIFHIIPNKSRLFPLNPVYSPAFGILFDGLNTMMLVHYEDNNQTIPETRNISALKAKNKSTDRLFTYRPFSFPYNTALGRSRVYDKDRQNRLQMFRVHPAAQCASEQRQEWCYKSGRKKAGKKYRRPCVFLPCR